METTLFVTVVNFGLRLGLKPPQQPLPVPPRQMILLQLVGVFSGQLPEDFFNRGFL
jgi:hypothetical protein